jgi:hypothetical protein
MPLEDMEIISAVFAGSLIREGFGRLCGPGQSFIMLIERFPGERPMSSFGRARGRDAPLH